MEDCGVRRYLEQWQRVLLRLLLTLILILMLLLLRRQRMLKVLLPSPRFNL